MISLQKLTVPGYVQLLFFQKTLRSIYIPMF